MEVMPTRIARLGMSPKPMVATYKSLVRAIGDGGSQVRVATDGDSLIIADLVLANAVVKAGIDNGKLSIPNWYSVGRIEGVGNIAFVALKMVDNTIVVDTTATAITGTVADDETITLDGMFGLFTTEQEAASYYYVGKECVIQKGNATMTMNTSQMGSYCIEALKDYEDAGFTNEFMPADIKVVNSANIYEYMREKEEAGNV